MSDLIRREDVERVVKEFNKRRVDRLPKNHAVEKHYDLCNAILDENVELLSEIEKIPRADVGIAIEEVRENICDNFCKYRDTADENFECEAIRNGTGCPLDRLDLCMDK